MNRIAYLLFVVLAGLVWPALGAQTEPKSDIFTATDGVKIRYLTMGDKGSWVVLIHGFTDNAQRMFFNSGIAQSLAAKHRVVAIDNRNHGSSDKPNPGARGRAEDVTELMDHLKIQKAHIHGYSMGGAFTAQLLAKYPARFVTASFGGSGISETDPALRAKAVAMDAPMPEPQGAEADAFKNLRDSAAKAAKGGGAVAGPGSPLAIDLKKVKIPVFAINGEFDSPHAKTERMARELKNFQSVVIPGKNHIGAVIAPMPLYVEKLTAFINSHDKK